MTINQSILLAEGERGPPMGCVIGGVRDHPDHHPPLAAVDSVDSAPSGPFVFLRGLGPLRPQPPPTATHGCGGTLAAVSPPIVGPPAAPRTPLWTPTRNPPNLFEP
jgi:hypothetical protein